MKTQFINTDKGKVEVKDGTVYWMKYHGCAWEVVKIVFELREWRILFLGSNRDEQFDFEFDNAEFREIKQPEV